MNSTAATQPTQLATELSGLDKAERIAALRTKMRRWGTDVVEFPAAASAPTSAATSPSATSAPTSPVASVSAESPTDPTTLPVPPGLRALFTASGMPGGLPIGGVSTIDRPGMVQAALIAAVTSQGKHVAIINEPELSLATVADLGGDLTRIAVIPDAGDSPLDIAAVLIEGVDLVTGYLPRTTMTRARPIDSRLRSHNSALLLIDGYWPSIQLQIHSELAQVAGLGVGHGRIRQLEWDVRLQAKSGLQATTRWSPSLDTAEAASAAVPASAVETASAAVPLRLAR